MSTFWQVFLGVISAWLVIQVALWPIWRRVTKAAEHGERIKVSGQKALANAVVDELERRRIR